MPDEKRNRSLRRLNTLVGEWEMQASVDGQMVGRGRTAFEWPEGGAFLVKHADGEPTEHAPAERMTNSPFQSPRSSWRDAVDFVAPRLSYRRPFPRRRKPMKYMLLIHQGTTPTPQSPDEWAKLSEAEQKSVYADYQAINQTPGVTPGLGLDVPETATTVRVQDGKTLTTDGPFVEIKESIGGYLLFEADDLDAAIELASRIPAARLGGAVEVRPIVEW
jgi:hypothetical protein